MVIAQQVKSRDRTDDIDITNTDLRSIGVVGARSLSSEYEDKVGDIVEDLLGRGFHIASGGAVGADEFAIARLVHIGMADRCTVYTPWAGYKRFPIKVRALSRQFKEYGGSIIWGTIRDQQDYVKLHVILTHLEINMWIY